MPQTFPTRAGSPYVLQQLQFFASRQQSHAARWGRPSQCVVCYPATAAPGVARASGGQRPLSCGRWGCRRSRRQHCTLRSLGCGHAALRSRRSSSVACVSGAERSAATGSALPPGPHPRFAGKGYAELLPGRAQPVAKCGRGFKRLTIIGILGPKRRKAFKPPSLEHTASGEIPVQNTQWQRKPCTVSTSPTGPTRQSAGSEFAHWPRGRTAFRLTGALLRGQFWF